MRAAERKQAKEAGHLFYETGKACKRGHVCKRYTINSLCVECDKERRKPKDPQKTKAYRRKVADQIVAYAALYRERVRSDPERAARQREQQRTSKAKFYLRDKPKILAQNRKRRALMAGAKGQHTPDDVDRIRKMQRGRCAYCASLLKENQENIDHITPIAKGGSNDARNIQITCRPCNNQKAAIDPIQFARRTGRLI